MKNFRLSAVFLVVGFLALAAVAAEPRICMTECVREKMTHTISPVFHKGVLYGFYQAGEAHTVENVGDPTELMRLSVLPWEKRTEMPRIVNVGVARQDFGSFVQTAERPPCAQTMTVRDDVLYLFFRGRRAEKAPGLWCFRTYDTRTGKMSEGAEICTLDGSEFNGETARDAYNRLTGDRQVKTAVGDECNVRRFSDGMYYTAMSVGGDSVGLVLRSENLRDWTSVLATPDLRKGWTWEYEIFELSMGTWMCAWRQEKLGSVWTATYDVASKTWSKPTKVENSIAVKPYLFRYRGVNYLATNLKGPVTTPGYGTAVRATLGVFRIGEDGLPKLVRKIVRPTGCHYVSTVEDDRGRLFLCYSTDERKLDATQCRSNIACEQLELEPEKGAAALAPHGVRPH